jgi:hypothetical protein
MAEHRYFIQMLKDRNGDGIKEAMQKGLGKRLVDIKSR